ncbi:NXPE family member 2-like isoform X1 [Hyperolius riggenbachi]|uniref:NXPE family member 2-like isoform X1 n=2 Tax=Hyperolius riggenbachi TaxID=752182 RepID=UPI0035A3BB46
MVFRCGLSSKIQIFWIVLIVFIIGISFTFHRALVQKLPHLQSLLSRISVIKDPLSFKHDELEDELEDEVQQIFDDVNSTMLNVFFRDKSETSSGAKSTARVLNYQPKYCIGDTLIVQVQMFNHAGERKTYGGDFLRARIFSPNLGAGASGRVEDFNNGTYNVYFTLFWEGLVKISILLMHPSEGVSALWRARSHGHKHLKYIGKFLNQNKEVLTDCGYELYSQGQRCYYGDQQTGEFYCMKLPGVPCEAFVSLSTLFEPYHYMTSTEQQLFTRSNMAVEIPEKVDHVEVVKCQNRTVEAKPKCKTGIPLQFPSGYFLNNLWHTLYCDVSSFERVEKISTCLAHKMVYLKGDSTLNQWLLYFPKLLKSLQFFGSENDAWHKTRFISDMTNKIYIQWRKHGYPLLVPAFIDVRDYADVVQQIDQIGGDADTVLVITVGHHFRPLPLPLYIRRLLNIRKAIQNMLLRSPDTKIIIKTENTRELDLDIERLGDPHGYIQYRLVKKIFGGLNIGMIDVWDMTVAYGSFELHPDETVVKNQINIFLSYIC